MGYLFFNQTFLALKENLLKKNKTTKTEKTTHEKVSIYPWYYWKRFLTTTIRKCLRITQTPFQHKRIIILFPNGKLNELETTFKNPKF